MLSQSTRRLLQTVGIGSEEEGSPEIDYAPPADVAHDDPATILTLKLKRKHQTAMLRQMLQNAGYTDLARMSAFQRERLEDDDQ